MFKNIFRKNIEESLDEQTVQIEETQVELEEIQGEVDQTTKMVSAKEKIFEKKQDQLVKSKLMLGEKIDTISQCEETLELLSSDLEKLERKRSVLQRENVDLEVSLHSTQSETDKIQIQIVQVKNDIVESSDKVKKNEDRIHIQASDISELEWELKNLKNELDVSTLKLNTQKLIVSKSHKEVRILTEDNNLKSKDQEILRRNIEKIEDQIESFDLKIVELNDEIKMINIDVTAKTEEIIDLKERGKSFELKITGLEARTSDLYGHVRELDEKIVRVQGKITNQNNELVLREKEYKELQQNIDSKTSFLTRQEELSDKNKTRLSTKLNEIGIIEEEILKSEKRHEVVQREVLLQAKLIASRKEKLKVQSSVFNSLLSNIANNEDRKNINLSSLRELKKKMDESTELIKEKEQLYQENKDIISEQEKKIFEEKMAFEKNDKIIGSVDGEIRVQESGINQNKCVLSGFVERISANKAKAEELEIRFSRNSQLLDKSFEKIKDAELLNVNLKDSVGILQVKTAEKDKRIKKCRIELEELATVKRELEREEGNQGNKISERNILIKTQLEFISTASVEVEEIEKTIEAQEKEARELNKAIENNKEEISLFDSEISHNRIRLNNVEKEIVSLVDVKTECEIQLHKNIDQIYQQSETIKKVSDDVTNYLSEVKNDARKRFAILKGTREGLNRSTRLVEEKIKSASKLKAQIKNIQYEYSIGQKELSRIHGQIKEVKKRVIDHEEILTSHRDVSDEMLGNTSTANNEIEKLVSQERVLLATIEEATNKIKVNKDKLEERQTCIGELNNRASYLNKKILTNQDEQENQELTLKKQTTHSSVLAKDVESLEKMSKSFQMKVEIQASELDKQSNRYDFLVKRNQELQKEITNLDTLFDNNRVIISNKVSKVDRLETQFVKKGKELLDKKFLAEKLSNHLIGDGMEEVNIANLTSSSLFMAMNSMKGRLENQFFNLTMNFDHEDFKEVREYSSTQLKTFEKVQKEFVREIESSLSIDAEVFVSSRIINGKMVGEFSVVDVGNLDTEVVKSIMLPFTKKMVGKYTAQQLSVDVRANITPSKSIQKVSIIVGLPLTIDKESSVIVNPGNVEAKRSIV